MPTTGLFRYDVPHLFTYDSRHSLGERLGLGVNQHFHAIKTLFIICFTFIFRLPSVGSQHSQHSGNSIHLDTMTSPIPPSSPQLNNSQAGLAASIAAGTAAVANGNTQDQQQGTQSANGMVKEKPYTQVRNSTTSRQV